MELYLDSANLKEIEEAVALGPKILTGLTTTPTFMQREGVKDVDATILILSKVVHMLHIEALGRTAEAVLDEAKRQLALGLDAQRTVFKIPVSLDGIRACAMLKNEGLRVNMHLVYTVQQAYMAMRAGADYVCPLVGRLQDQGYDAMPLLKAAVAMRETYGYSTKVMFSSVRNTEHVRNALVARVQAVTVPLKILKGLTENNLTAQGTQEFERATRLMTVRVRDAMRMVQPTVPTSMVLGDALVKMTEFGFGALMVLNDDGSLRGMFTDGDLRRQIQRKGRDIVAKRMGDFEYRAPIAIDANAVLNEAMTMFNKTKVDTLLVSDNGKFIGLLDIQDLAK